MGRGLEGVMGYKPDRHDRVIAEIRRVKVYACGALDYITIDDGIYDYKDVDTCATLTRDEAIAVARTILKHFNCEMEN